MSFQGTVFDGLPIVLLCMIEPDHYISHVRQRMLVCSSSNLQERPGCREAVTIPSEIANSVVRLQAPNPDAPEGHTDVYVLGMSHVSKESVAAVRSLITAVKPEVPSIH